MSLIKYSLVLLVLLNIQEGVKANPLSSPSFLLENLSDLNFSEHKVRLIDKSLTGHVSDPVDLYSKISPAVFRVIVASNSKQANGKKNIATGSAVNISTDYFLTNCHIFGRPDELEQKKILIKGHSGGLLQANLFKQDFKTDRCILQLTQNRDKLPDVKVISVRNKDSVKVGERVYAIGNPKGFENALSEGLISAIHKSKNGKKVFLTTAGTAKGSSGGALFDDKGNLIGITTAVIADAPHLSIVIPAQDFLSFSE